jgi:hypothetical protein
VVAGRRLAARAAADVILVDLAVVPAAAAPRGPRDLQEAGRRGGPLDPRTDHVLELHRRFLIESSPDSSNPLSIALDTVPARVFRPGRFRVVCFFGGMVRFS